MFITKSSFTTKSGKIYQSTLLRESYREGGRVKKRTIANLSHCSPNELQAIELALRYKNDLSNLGSFESSVAIKEGLSVGGVLAIYQVAKDLGIVAALGNHRDGKLALWQVIARVLEQGSRLSSVRLAETYALSSVLSVEFGFNEDALYKNLKWLSRNQKKIEDDLFIEQEHAPILFLYDVTSSYLEGDENELADWGYNRDGKKGKKQIVIGLLSDDTGNPVSIEVFKGNTNDTTTFYSQIEKARDRFGCKEVTFVGDRGMIKSGQIKELAKHGFSYITAITKKQIETLVKNDVIQYELFDDHVCEIEEENIRYIFRRNPVRAQEISECRDEKKESIERLVEERNRYLLEHRGAKETTALKRVEAKIKQLQISNWLSVKSENRRLTLAINEEVLAEEAMLDGCYVIKTDLKKEWAGAKTIHDRYKDLAFVESAFRTCKSSLDLRPVYVRLKDSTYGHVFVVMLAYMIVRYMDQKWSSLYLTVEEGLRSLSTLTLQEITIKDQYSFQKLPEPRLQNKKMLEALNVEFPKILPKGTVNVVTRKNRRQVSSKI
jgi:transposase